MSDLFTTHLPALIIAIPLFAAFLTPLISRINGKGRNFVVIVALLMTFILTIKLAWHVYTDGTFLYAFGSSDASGFALHTPAGYVVPIRILFEIDAMSALMGIITSSLALLGAIYSWNFVEKYETQDKYYTLLLLMTVGMFGMVFTGDLFNMFVFLEVLSISGAALVAFRTEKGASIEAGLKYMIISSLGAMFMLFAVCLLYGQYDLLNLAALAKRMDYTLLDEIALVALIGAFAMKSGAAPMHMWVPDAYGEAPASISLMLVASTQASLYALFRVVFTLYGAHIDPTTIGWLFIIFGLLSIMVGVSMALMQDNLKRLIGYTAVAEIGYMMLAVGVAIASMGSGYSLMALKAGIFHILNDALDIGLLFLVAGVLFYRTGARNLAQLGGLARNMKYTTFFFMIGLAAVAGLPPTNGFASKLLIYESIYLFNPVLAIIAILASIFMLAIFVKVFHSAFLGPELPSLAKVKEAPPSMLIPMAILALVMIIIGLFPNLVYSTIVCEAAKALLDQGGYIAAMIGGA